MRAIRKFPLLVAAGIMLVLALNGAAQQPKVLAPHRPINPRVPNSRIQHPAVERSLVGGFWTIDANRKATIYLKNSLEISPLTVAPILYLSNGARYSLTPVTIEPSGTAVVSINDALEKQGIAPYATLSGYLEVQYMWAWDPICATVVSVDPVHSVIFTYGLLPSDATKIKHFAVPPPKVIDGLNAVEGMWWKPEANVTGFVALSNTSSADADASVFSSDDHNRVLAEQTVHLAPHVTKIVKLDELVSVAPGTAGGLRVSYSGRGDGIVISGGLEDQTSGYSAILPFHLLGFPPAEHTGIETYAEVGLMTGQADPMMAFPAGTVFTPFSVVRNVGDQPLRVTPNLYWMQGGQARSARLPSFTMEPFETRALDVRGLQSTAGLKGFNGSINLTLDAQGQSRSLLLASGSVDQKNNYVFQVAPHSVQESASKSVSYWSTANGDDTMVTVWNPADEAQDYIFTLLYSGGHYRTPIHLEARATQTFNISEVVQNPTPDAEGNVIPATLHDGSATIAGTHADNEGILVVLDAGTYNVRKATCTWYCITCNGWWSASLIGTPFTIPQGGGTTLTLQDQWNTGATYSLSGNWTSSNTAVATVGANNGSVNGVAPGSSNFTGTGQDYVYTSNYCAVDPICGPQSSPQGSGGGNVITLTLSPSIFNMSSGDTNVTIGLTISPSAASVQPTFTASLSSNPNSSNPASVTVTNPSSAVSGSYNAPISVSGTNPPSGRFNILAVANGVSSNVADLAIPPQILIQMMEAEAGGTNNTTITAVGEVVRNRFSSSIFNPPYSTYQLAIVPGQFASSSTPNGIEPELDIAASVFIGVSAGNFCGSLAFWTPTSAQWQTVQSALQSGATTFPSDTGAPTYSTWSTSQQQILYVPAVGTNSQGVPYFLWLTQRSPSQPAAINASCN